MAVHFRNFVTSNSQRSVRPDALETEPMLAELSLTVWIPKCPGRFSCQKTINDGLRPPRD